MRSPAPFIPFLCGSLAACSTPGLDGPRDEPDPLTAACARSLEARRCPGIDAYPDCLDHQGNVTPPGARGDNAAGEPCLGAHQCATGDCSSSAGLECGHCRSPRALGEPCGGLYDHCTGGGVCTDWKICVLPGKVEGEPSIDLGQECQATLYCKTDANRMGVCTKLGTLGAAPAPARTGRSA